MPSYVRGDSNFDTASAKKLTLMAAQNSTSGTNIDFVGIPSWAKKITVMFSGVSTSGTSVIQIQLGSGSIQTSGYSASAMLGTTTLVSATGFPIQISNVAADSSHGLAQVFNLSENMWTESGTLTRALASTTSYSAGAVTISGTLDRIRITTVNGTDTFDAGSINVMYEG